MNNLYLTPDDFNNSTEYMNFKPKKVPSFADCVIPIEGDGMEPVFHDGQYVFLQRCNRLDPYEPGAFLVNGKAYLRLYTVKYEGAKRVEILIVYEDHRREPIVITDDTDFHIIGRVFKDPVNPIPE